MIEKIQAILRCPKTSKKLFFDKTQNCFTVENENFTYPFYNGIIDFSSSFTKDVKTSNIITSYNKISKIYDSLISSSTLLSKMIIYLTWGGFHEEYTYKVINFIPDDFDGILLDIPVGTGIYSFEKYSKLKNATIIVAEISLDMLYAAQKRYAMKNINNVIYILADVANLPFISNSIDFVTSMNGFHSFPDKEKAVDELARILKQNAIFSGCFYVSKKRLLSDFMVKFSLEKQNLFSEPFYTEKEYIEMFEKYFSFRNIDTCRSFFIFNASKKSD